jgi:hypothetical protein
MVILSKPPKVGKLNKPRKGEDSVRNCQPAKFFP